MNGPFAYQISYDPTQLPAGYQFASIGPGLISLSSFATGSWLPAVAATSKPPAAWRSATTSAPFSQFLAANPSATLSQLVGSSGIDPATNTVWAVIDQPGEYAVGVQAYTQQTFTISVS